MSISSQTIGQAGQGQAVAGRPLQTDDPLNC